MAEKMQPALLVTAHPAKKARKRKPEAEKARMKKSARVNIGAAFEWWRQLGHVEGLSRGCSLSVGQVMICFVLGAFVIFMKYLMFANLATFLAHISLVLTLASLCVVFSHENG